MQSKLLAACAVVALTAVASASVSSAEANDDLLRRLEARVDALAKENASLRLRLTKIEAAPRTAKTNQQGYVGPVGTSSASPTPQQIAAAREAQAADMSVVAKYAPPSRPACAQFGGWYVGGQVGSATHLWNAQDRNGWARNEVDLVLPDSVEGTKRGWLVGGQIGWNWQAGCTVFGIETDWNWTDVGQTKYNTDGQPGAALDQLTTSSDMKWFGTARTRAGIVVDNLMIYLTGGFAFAKVEYSSALTNNIGGVFVTETFASSKNRNGWVVGVGTEWAWTQNWSLKTEVLYAQFVDSFSPTYTSRFAALNGNPTSKNFDYEDSVWVARAALAYRWGGR